MHVLLNRFQCPGVVHGFKQLKTFYKMGPIIYSIFRCLSCYNESSYSSVVDVCTYVIYYQLIVLASRDRVQFLELVAQYFKCSYSYLDHGITLKLELPVSYFISNVLIVTELHTTTGCELPTLNLGRFLYAPPSRTYLRHASKLQC